MNLHVDSDSIFPSNQAIPNSTMSKIAIVLPLDGAPFRTKASELNISSTVRGYTETMRPVPGSEKFAINPTFSKENLRWKFVDKLAKKWNAMKLKADFVLNADGASACSPNTATINPQAVFMIRNFGHSICPHFFGNIVITGTKKQFDKAGDVTKILPYFETIEDYYDALEN